MLGSIGLDLFRLFRGLLVCIFCKYCLSEILSIYLPYFWFWTKNGFTLLGVLLFLIFLMIALIWGFLRYIPSELDLLWLVGCFFVFVSFIIFLWVFFWYLRKSSSRKKMMKVGLDISFSKKSISDFSDVDFLSHLVLNFQRVFTSLGKVCVWKI